MDWVGQKHCSGPHAMRASICQNGDFHHAEEEIFHIHTGLSVVYNVCTYWYTPSKAIQIYSLVEPIYWQECWMLITANISKKFFERKRHSFRICSLDMYFKQVTSWLCPVTSWRCRLRRIFLSSLAVSSRAPSAYWRQILILWKLNLTSITSIKRIFHLAACTANLLSSRINSGSLCVSCPY